MTNHSNIPDNPAKTKGFLFIEYTSKNPTNLEQIFFTMDLRLVGRHKKYDIDLWCKNDIVFVLNKMKGGCTEQFAEKHGDSVCGFGFLVEDAKVSFAHCVSKKAVLDHKGDKWYSPDNNEGGLYAIDGIADTRLYLGDKTVIDYKNLFHKAINVDVACTESDAQLLKIDHITHNVFRGNMDTPDSYYSNITKRLPHNKEDVDSLKKLKILIDGEKANNSSEMKILLQIFTDTMIGPVFFEIIQRKGNEGFGEGNFRALFKTIEHDQIVRGVI